MRLPISILLAVQLAAACSGNLAPLVATDVVVNEPVPGTQMAAGYLTLRNQSDEAITITRVTSPQYEAVEMHETTVDNGISRMAAIPALTIEPSSSIVFQPGGNHLMLMCRQGQPGAVTLQFHSDDTVVLTVTVAETQVR